MLEHLQHPISYKQFNSNLASVAQSLTSLDICFSRRGTHIPCFSETLVNLPNLTSLRYDVEQEGCSPPVFFPITLPHPTRLKRLALRSETEKMNGTEFQKLLMNSPDLRCLSIGNCDDSVYATIEEYGHNIKELYINHLPISVSHGNVDASVYAEIEKHGFSTKNLPKNPPNFISLGSNEYCSDRTPGLKHLTVDNFDSPNWLLSLIKQNHTTLRTLSLRPTLKAVLIHTWSSLFTSLPLSNLISLSIYDIDNYDLTYEESVQIENIDEEDVSVSKRILPLMMVNNEMPHLQSLCLSHATPIPDVVFVALEKMPNLSELALTSCTFNAPNMKAFLERCGQKSKTGKSLNKLVIDKDCIGTDHDVIYAASSIQSLTWLDLYYHDGDEESIKILVGNVVKIPLLQHIKLSHMEMSLADLLVLRTCSSLNHVELDTNYWLTQEDIQKAAFSSNVKVVFQEAY